ncbi:DUF6161 domain-containing protein [Pseudomonas fluorescens]|uniref:DUF6161 domain-containing protein n=1 Tax=Pseudomonas fluorescens TaxID=294 RepID=UPI00178083E9|nr:DUF6161 domain-containing protein [Pseudomonas fluorescens]MBD8236955.1 hypothetical protein [Pseudomonas fluorescens]MDY0898215.1 DUF6161 domain-containing protein [Pseudomonas fluorescens]
MQTEPKNFNNDERFQKLRKMSQKFLSEWLEHENEFWTEINVTLDDIPEDAESKGLVEQYLNILNEAPMLFGGLDELENFQAITPIPFHDDAPLSYRLLEITKKGQFSLAICTFQLSLNNISNTYTKSYETHLKEVERSFFEKMDQEKNNFTTDLEKKISNINDSIQSTQKSTLHQLEEKLKASKEEIFNTVSATNSAIYSAEPVQYWVEREAKHKKKANTYFWFITAAAVLFTATLVLLTISVYKNGETYEIGGIPITLPAEKFSIALLIIATTASIWLVRVLVKLMMTNLALEIEALERSTMIKTFIAMDKTKAEHASEIRMLFYSTLFKPSNNSLTDDSTSPEYIRIIEAMLQKKST